MLQIGIYTASYTKYTQNAVLHILLTCCGHLLPPRTFIQNLWQPKKKKKKGQVAKCFINGMCSLEADLPKTIKMDQTKFLLKTWLPQSILSTGA